MLNSYLFIGVFSTILVLTNAKGVFNTCKDGYENMKDSTMCYESDSENYIDGGVTDADKKVILAEHNKFRAAANPEASDLFKLYWDDAVAAVAQKLTQQCRMYHDKNRRVASLPGVYVGQNAAAGQRNWVGTVGAWHSEVRYFEYGKGVNTSGKAIGHYTQVVNNNAIRIGCGFSKCSDGYKRFYVCNYAVGQYGTTRPYKSGKQCAACPKHCTKDGLCDCAGLLCQNRGKLDKKTCKCKCRKEFGGKDCSEVLPCKGMKCHNNGKLDTTDCKCSCPKNTYGKECEFLEDETADGQIICKFSMKTFPQGSKNQCLKYGSKGKDGNNCKKSHTSGGWGCDACVRYSNVPTSYCPIMCGICPPQVCRGKVCYNGGKLKKKDCSCKCPKNTSGKECEVLEDMSGSAGTLVCRWSNRDVKTANQAQCMNFKSKGTDSSICKSNGGNWGCGHCTKYSNVPKDYCPVMCGLCDAEP